MLGLLFVMLGLLFVMLGLLFVMLGLLFVMLGLLFVILGHRPEDLNVELRLDLRISCEDDTRKVCRLLRLSTHHKSTHTTPLNRGQFVEHHFAFALGPQNHG